MRAAGFSFLFFALALGLVLGVVGGLNVLIDPLWYLHGNQLSGRNFPFNERIAKVNLFNRTFEQGYDCLILGSSRVTALHPSRFQGYKCFNFALKGAEAPEQLAYGRYARERGLRPKLLVVAVDDFNFIVKTETARRSNPKVEGTPDLRHAFLSTDVLTFSLLTLAGIGPDRDYYDANFELQRLRPAPPLQPEVHDLPDLACSAERAARFIEIRALFPEARAIAYTPPRSPWSLLNDLYLRRVLDCSLDSFHRVAQHYDAFLDFGIPSALTEDNALTDDGSHFSPAANERVVDGLQGRAPDLAIEVRSLDLAAYKAEVRRRLHDFMRRENLLGYWHD